MSILPNLEKNAYLVVYIKDFYISTSLIYSDFSISRYYIQESILEHVRVNQLTDFQFWKEYFLNLEKHLSWEIIHKGTGNLINFGGEGTGLRGIEVVIDNRYFKDKVSDIVNGIRGYILDTNIRFVDNRYIEEMLAGVSRKLGYEDILFLDMNIKNFNIYRYSINTSGGVLTHKIQKNEFSQGHIDNQGFNSVVNRIYDSTIKAFVTKPIKGDQVINDWANYVNNYGLFVANSSMQDILRSYILAQILTIRNDNPKKFDEFGTKNRKSLILVSGSLMSNIDYKSLMLSVIDGFELMGDIDIAFDSNQRMVPFANNYINGSIQSSYIVSVEDILSKVMKLIIPTNIKSEKSRKVIMDVDLNSVTLGNQKYFGFTNELTFINLPDQSYSLNAKFLNSTELYEKDTYEYVTSNKDLRYSQFIFDARVRPIVYGPTDQENLVKISSWINEEGTEINK